MPNFRMPTMDDVIGNLGEPLDFGQHHFDDEDGARDDGAHVNADGDANQQDSAGPSGSNSADADVLDINDIELEEVCSALFLLYGRCAHLLERVQLRLSPTFPV